jgi:anthranilate/para-aminobenzoate synthase component II
VQEADLPAVLEITARAPDGEIMALAHKRAPAWGVQFHPESILTPDGPALLGNFLATRASLRSSS